ncbi:hypothetical protein PI125_g20086 [Phytophthora idaei]|nr:hypothetical protein PI125_g20086 [Phytophthora idaei]
MTSISKAFNDIVSTTQEGQPVGKILAGWDSKAEPCLPTLHVFDVVVRHKIQQLQHALFASAFGFSDSMNLRADALEVPMAVAMLHYRDMLKLAPEGPYIEQMKRTIK